MQINTALTAGCLGPVQEIRLALQEAMLCFLQNLMNSTKEEMI